jgi:guanylate kinase
VLTFPFFEEEYTMQQKTITPDPSVPRGIRFLGIVGVSGSGKNTLQDNLCDKPFSSFHKTRQVTTRNRRDGETCYDFLSDSVYDALDDNTSLFARTGFLGKRYGTRIDSLDSEKINTIILNQDGLDDLLAWAKVYNWRVDVIGLDVPDSWIFSLAGREGRDTEFFSKERKVLKSARYIFTCDPSSGKFTDRDTVEELMMQWEKEYRELSLDHLRREAEATSTEAILGFSHYGRDPIVELPLYPPQANGPAMTWIDDDIRLGVQGIDSSPCTPSFAGFQARLEQYLSTFEGKEWKDITPEEAIEQTKKVIEAYWRPVGVKVEVFPGPEKGSISAMITNFPDMDFDIVQIRE